MTIHRSNFRSKTILVFVVCLTISGTAFGSNAPRQIDGVSSTLPAPQLLAPVNGASDQPTRLTLVWRSAPNAQYYKLQVSTWDSTFSSSFINDSSLTDTMRTVDGLPGYFTLFWRVKARNSGGISPYSPVWNFRTGAPSDPGEVFLSSPANNAGDIFLPVSFSWNATPGAISYTIQVSTDSLFTITTYDQSDITSTSTSISSLANNTLYYWRMRATATGGTGIWSRTWNFTTVSSSPPPSLFDPILYMPLDGNTQDLSRSRFYTFISERADWVPDRFGMNPGACGFNGYIGSVGITGRLSFDVRGESYSVSCWVRLDSLTPDRNQEIIFDHLTWYPTSSSYDLFYQGSHGRFVARCWDGTREIVVPGTTRPITGQWYHVAMVADTRRITLYVNGERELSDSGAFNTDAIPGDFGSTRNIMNDGSTVGDVASISQDGHHHLHGAIDELRIHNRALSALEVDSLFHRGVPPSPPPTDKLALYMPFDGSTVDASGNGNTGTSSGNSYYYDPWGHPGSAYSFRGGNLHASGITVPSSSSLHPTDGLTIAFWLRGENAQSVWKLVSKSAGDQPPDREYFFGLSVSRTVDSFAVSAATPDGGAPELAGGGTPFWEWHHVAAVIDRKDSHTTKLYIDGALSATTADNAGGFVPNDQPLLIGEGQGVISSPSAFMDELRIYTRALSGGEVYSLYRFIGGQATPMLAASETRIDFGFVRLGESASHDITLTNTSVADTVHINAITNNNPDFSVGATAPLLIAPGGNQALHLVYSPTTVGIDTDVVVQIAVSDPGVPPVWLSLFGRALSDSSQLFHTNSGWNIVSVPVVSADRSKSSLFPTVISSAFAYVGQYVQADTLITGMGYWMKFQKAGANFVDGDQIVAQTISVKEGWNLIGSISNPVPVSSITSDAEGTITSQFFGFSNGYFTADTIQPGQGYWVKVDRDGKLILTEASAMDLAKVSAARIRIIPTSEMPPPAPDEKSVHPNPRPAEFSLNQNYPNPFNPATTLQYTLPVDSKVKLTIYNMLGESVATLVNETETAGFKSVRWDASDLSSGIYFYTLEASSVTDPGKNFTQMRKLLLIK